MSASDDLKEQVIQLQKELEEREQDISLYRSELERVNGFLEALIAEFTRDVQSLARLQKSLVPTEFPHIQGFEFSTKFVPSHVSGGDYLDIFEHENKFRFGLVLSSASNYSVSAQLLSTFLDFSGQMEARRGASPEKMVKKIFDEISGQLNPGDKADLLYSYVDRKSFTWNYCLCGKVLAYIQCAETGKLEPLEECGGPLVADSDEKWVLNKYNLNPNDKIIICSPGVIEATNLEDEPFGEPRLMKAIMGAPKGSVHDLRNEIFFQVEQFCSGVEPPRDKSIIIASVKDKVIKLA